MKRVATATARPGICAISGRSEGPFIDTGRDLVPRTGRMYVSVRTAIELGVAGGCMHPVPAAQLQERLAIAERELARLAGVEAEYDRLLDAVSYTLQHGAVVRNKAIALRSRPGQKAVNLR